jgi:Domain of unknown function (DUF1844)
VPRPSESDVPRPDSPGSLGSPDSPGSPGDTEEGPTDEQVRQLARELANAPVEDIIANHCYGLFELGALHLSQEHVDLPSARMAIDALGYLVDGLGDRLGSHAATLKDAVTQIRLAYVRLAEAGAGKPETEPGT